MVTPDGVGWLWMVTPDGVRWLWMVTPDGVGWLCWRHLMVLGGSGW